MATCSGIELQLSIGLVCYTVLVWGTWTTPHVSADTCFVLWTNKLAEEIMSCELYAKPRADAKKISRGAIEENDSVAFKQGFSYISMNSHANTRCRIFARRRRSDAFLCTL